MIYFRRSKLAQKFFNFAEYITVNWDDVKTKMLVNCHDTYPSTDVVYALAYRLLDPTNKKLIDYEWFKFLHHKPGINGLMHKRDQNNYLYTNRTGDSIYLGEKRVSRVWHYHDKELHDQYI